MISKCLVVMNSRTLLRIGAVLVGLVTALTVGVLWQRSARSVSLDVPDRADANPWVAAAGSFVAVAWGARSSGKTDVFLAVSRDGGSTFGPPVQVNAIAGEARLGGELPPRIALVSSCNDWISPEIVVLWTAHRDATEVKVARSGDGGRSFAAPVTLQSRGAGGDRGWPAVALDQRAIIHVIWLDLRGLAKDGATGVNHSGHKGEHDGVAMAQKSGLYYASMADGASPERELNVQRLLLRKICTGRRRGRVARMPPGGTSTPETCATWPSRCPEMEDSPSYLPSVSARTDGRSMGAPTMGRRLRWTDEARFIWRGRQ